MEKLSGIRGTGCLVIALGLSACGQGLYRQPGDLISGLMIAPVLKSAGPLVGTVGMAIQPYRFQNDGGFPGVCVVSPTLPLGFVLSPSCDLTGTPLFPQAAQNYTVTGTNIAGSSTAVFSIAVSDAIPQLQNGGIITGFVNQPISPLLLSNLGGAVSSCAATPALPSGLIVAVSKGSCQLSGTPSSTSSQTMYTIIGRNGSGVSQAAVIFGASNSVPALSGISSILTSVGVPALQLPFSNLGGGASVCTVTPALPSGLSLTQALGTCQITGIPTAVHALTTYTVTATNGAGSGSTATNITVSDSAPILATVGNLITPVLNAVAPFAVSNTGGAATACSVVPTLPAGLSVGVSSGTCTITGTPTVLTPLGTYTINASNSVGTGTTTLGVGIGDIAPALAPLGAVSSTLNSALGALGFTNSGGAVTSCTPSSALPSGVSVIVANGTCQLQGTPAQVLGPTLYSITGSNNAGSSIATATLSVADLAPVLTSVSTIAAPILSALSPITISNAGGAATSCGVTPSLPTGLSLNLVGGTCQITGTPTLVSALSNYSVTATNATGASTALVPLGISNIPPQLAAAAPMSVSALSAMTPVNLPNSGGAALSCLSSPFLPTGLVVLPVSGTCQISGTPATVSATASYTITGTNLAGSSSAIQSITIVDRPPSLAGASALNIPILSSIIPVSFANSGGAATSCSVSPGLPAGLSVNLVGGTCVLSGIPTSVAAVSAYTVTATNSAGSSTGTISLMTLNIAPHLTAAAPISMAVLSILTPVALGNTGGAVITCSSSPALPLGLLVLPLGGTCQISGTALAVTAAASYTITGSNLVGSSSATQTITVVP